VRANAVCFTIDASDQAAQNYRSHFDGMMVEYKEMKENIKKPVSGRNREQSGYRI
jgi:hypothetical protein